MHSYYAENKEKLKKGLSQFMQLVKPELERAGGKPYSALLEEIWDYYEKNLLERFPYTSMEAIGHIMVLCYERYYLKMPGLLRKAMGRIYKSPKLLNRMLLKKDAKNKANAVENPGSFETETQIPPEAGYDFSYHNLVCPLSIFARKYGYEEYMPYLCNLDYVMFGVLGAPLFREHTCFEDGDYCDFKLKIGAKPLPYWPPVFRQDNPYK